MYLVSFINYDYIIINLFAVLNIYFNRRKSGFDYEV